MSLLWTRNTMWNISPAHYAIRFLDRTIVITSTTDKYIVTSTTAHNLQYDVMDVDGRF
jgi:hypothetical protein